MRQHTPEPWKVEDNGAGVLYVHAGALSLKTIIATIESLCDGIDNEAREREREANSRLIAAAPELLEALTLATFELPRQEITASQCRSILNDHRHQTVESIQIAKKALGDANSRISAIRKICRAAIDKAEVKP